MQAFHFSSGHRVSGKVEEKRSNWRRHFPYYLLIWLMPFILFKYVRTEVDPSSVKPFAACFIALLYGLWLWLRRRRQDNAAPFSSVARAWLRSLYRDLGSLSFFFMLILFILSRLHHPFPGSLLLNQQERWEGLLFFIALFVLYRMGLNAPALGDSFWSSFGISAGLSVYCRIAEYYKFPLIVNPTRLIIGSNFRQFSDFDGFPFSTQGNPNFFSTYLALTIPVSVYLLLQRKKPWALLPLALQLFALVINESRSGMVGLLFAFPVYWLLIIIFEKNKSGFLWAAMLSAPILLFISSFLLLHFFPGTQQRLQLMVTQGEQLLSFVRGEFPLESALQLGSSRGYGYYTAYLALLQYPWLGLGFGAVREATSALLLPLVPESFRYVYENTYHTPHNVYLQRASESGLPSLFCYLFLVIASLVHAFRHLRRNPRYAFLIFAILSYAIQALFNVATPGTSWLFFFYLGLAAGNQGMDLEHE